MMMVIIYGGVAVDPARVAELTAIAAEFQAKCRAEDGCADYTLAWEVAEPNRIRLLEAWETEEAYQAHTGQPHVAEWTELIQAASVGAPTFHRDGVRIA
jgi:quinol monooxygenase YgiN